MFSEIGDHKLFGATVILWVLVAFTTFLDLASALPPQLFENGLSRRAGNPPGIGVELEAGRIVIKGKADLTPAQREQIKGAEMIPIGFTGEPKTYWQLTAELGQPIFPEAIVDGTKNKVGGHKTASIGAEILKFFQGWAPCANKDCKVTIKGFDNLGPWSVQWPKNAGNPATFTFGSQVTTAMPLEAVLQIFGDSKSRSKTNPLASSGALYADKINILTKDNFKSFSKIKASDIDDEFLGFFSILASYCTLAHFSDPKHGPKHLIPIMPRTDFVTQYNTFIAAKLKAQLSDKTTSLYDIIQAVTGSDPSLAAQAFKWATGTITPIKDNWDGKADDIKAGTLAVSKFLNYLQGYDKISKKSLPQMDLLTLMDKTMRHGQIGGLGKKMEDILGTTKLVPIFEFRELAQISGSDLATTLGSYEDKVISYHQQAAKQLA